MNKQHLAIMAIESAKTHKQLSAMQFKWDGVWKNITFATAGETMHAVARALLSLDVQSGDMVGIFSQNRPEWAFADYGVLMTTAVSVPIFATNTPQQAAYIIEETEMKILFVDGQANYDKIKTVAPSLPHLQTIIAFDESVELISENDLHFSELLSRGTDPSHDADIDARLNNASANDLATLIYTSGTTGEPKGVMLTHANIFHQFVAMEGSFNVNSTDRSLCFLPLSHVYERSWSFYVFKSGAQNYFLQNPREILAAMQEVQPTAMVSVPRLYEKIFATAYHKLKDGSALKQRLFHWAVAVGTNYQAHLQQDKSIRFALNQQHKIADKLVLSKIRDVVGGPKNFFSAGGAPLSKEIEAFFLAAGLLVCQGYGLTECSPMVSFNTPKAFKFGTVGKLIPQCEVKIAANGEILVKGPGVMQGYYKKEEATTAVLTNDWFSTGDVGEFDADGYLRITDRIKNLIITSGGKNIAPQHIETELAKAHYIEQMIVIGDRRKFITALIVPNFEVLESFAQEKGIQFSSHEELIQHPDVVTFYRAHIDHHSQELAAYEQVKQFTLLPTPFTQENGELTPTQKLKRKIVIEKYADSIDAMYPDD